MTLKLPQNANVTVNVNSETNEVTAEGFKVEDNNYSYKAVESSIVNLDIQITFDLGQVTLELV